MVAKEKFKPDFFFYENNKSASKPIKDQISAELGQELMYVNSALVSAQNRERFYVFNWDAPQPKDRGIRLVDILETITEEKSYNLDSSFLQKSAQVLNVNPSGKGMNGAVIHPYGKNRCLTTNKGEGQKIIEPIRIGTIENSSHNKDFDSQQYRVYSPEGKSVTICGNGGGVGAKTGLYAIPINGLKNGKSRVVDSHYANLEYKTWYKRVYNENPAKQQHDYIAEQVQVYAGREVGRRINQNGKRADYDTSVERFQRIEINENFDKTNCISTVTKDNVVVIPATGKEYPIYEVSDGLIIIKDKTYPINLPDGHYIIRKLTPIECERLQTMPDNYTSCVSNSQRYKCLGNGWTAEVIKHLWEYGIGQLNRNEPIEVLSMYDGIATARYVLESMGFTNIYYKAYEIDKYAIQVAQHNYPDIIQCGDAFQVREADWSYSNIGIAV